MKFKPGDEVVIVEIRSGDGSYYNIGDRATVLRGTNEREWLCKFEDGDSWYVSDYNMEINKLVGTPLWEALK